MNEKNEAYLNIEFHNIQLSIMYKILSKEYMDIYGYYYD